MKALTVHQPWATLIGEGRQRYETRSWSTKYRGTLAIHAGKETRWLQEMVKKKHRPAFPLGAVVAVATLAACLPTDGLEVSNADASFGDFTPGRFAWEMSKVYELPYPVMCRGHQQIWTLPDEIGNQLAREYAAYLQGLSL